MTLMIMWRIWHCHNEITHDKPMPPIEGSKRFLMSYLDSLLSIKQAPKADPIKGKNVVSNSQGFSSKMAVADGHRQRNIKWQPPRDDMLKLNTDGSFVHPQEAGIGMILRDHHGQVIVAASKSLPHCADATEVELAAIEEGMALAMNWTQMNFMIESDCSEALYLIKNTTPNTSMYASRIQVIREFLRERAITLAKAYREANTASHALAKLGRVGGRNEIWFDNFPPEIAKAIDMDCNSIMI
jgi:ribonuclease HI